MASPPPSSGAKTRRPGARRGHSLDHNHRAERPVATPFNLSFGNTPISRTCAANAVVRSFPCSHPHRSTLSLHDEFDSLFRRVGNCFGKLLIYPTYLDQRSIKTGGKSRFSLFFSLLAGKSAHGDRFGRTASTTIAPMGTF